VIAGLQVCIRFHGTADGVSVNIDGKDHHGTYPHLFIKREGEIHQIDEGGAADSFYFTYPYEQAPAIPEDLVVSEIALIPEIHAHIHHVLELLPHCHESGVADRIDGLCLQLLIALLLQHGRHAAVSEDTERIRKISSYIQMHYTDALDFDAIARHFGYSPRSFYRHWRQYHGVPPASYVSRLKLDEAKRLLSESSFSVAAISERLGYRSSAYFVYCFRKHSGKTPLQYRKAALP
jgi:AraC-like DNA-binding protein